MFLKVLIFALLLTGCATHSEDLKAKFQNSPSSFILEVPFHKQAEFHCAPAALSMMMGHIHQEHSYDEITKMLYAPDAKGTYQNDLIAAIRRLSLLALPVSSLMDIVREIQDGKPVLIFQNLGLSWLPKWHYAVVVGYDLAEDNLILHTGNFRNYPMSMATFMRTWERVDHWGYTISLPDSIPTYADEKALINAAAGLELAKNFKAAQTTYESILGRWPESFGATVGLGNVHYQQTHFQKAKEYLKKATILRPTSARVWNNYAVVLKVLGDEEGAREAELNSYSRQL